MILVNVLTVPLILMFVAFPSSNGLALAWFPVQTSVVFANTIPTPAELTRRVNSALEVAEALDRRMG